MTSDALVQRFHELQSRIATVCARANRSVDTVRTVVVTKTHPVETAQQVIDLGMKEIGENRVQEILAKAPALRGDYTMHLIGHLQSNKIGKVLPLVHWIQSIDSTRLIDAIDARGEGLGRMINALVQVNTSGEETKSGCSPQECRAVCERVAASSVLKLRGLMTIGPLGNDERALREAFASLRRLSEHCADLVGGSVELSMGMSDDLHWAIEEGATIVRVGTALLGSREAPVVPGA